MRVASGGGLGDPLERDPELVRQDLKWGVISEQTAREIYGILIDQNSGKVDPAATESLRTKLKKSSKLCSDDVP
jgi:N-methylhydantoinase B